MNHQIPGDLVWTIWKVSVVFFIVWYLLALIYLVFWPG